MTLAHGTLKQYCVSIQHHLNSLNFQDGSRHGLRPMLFKSHPCFIELKALPELRSIAEKTHLSRTGNGSYSPISHFVCVASVICELRGITLRLTELKGAGDITIWGVYFVVLQCNLGVTAPQTVAELLHTIAEKKLLRT